MCSNPTYLFKDKYTFVPFMSNLYLFPVYLQTKKNKNKKERKKENSLCDTENNKIKAREMFYFDLSSPCFSHKLILMPAFLKLENSTKVK